jgi:RNA polymerase sigma-54 factor
MNFGLDLSLHVGMEQKLSPQMIQSLKLLQMNSLELEMVVKQELETNPLLEPVEEGEEIQDANQSESEPASGDTSNEASQTAEEIRSEVRTDDEFAPADRLSSDERISTDDPKDTKEIDWESYLEEGFDHGNKRSEELESPDERFERVPVYSKTLQDYLLGQLQDRMVHPKVAALVDYLINSLDERGYLVPEQEIRPESDAQSGEVNKPAGKIKELDEKAIAARDALEKADAVGSQARELRTQENGGIEKKAQAADEANPYIREIQGIIDGSLGLDLASHDVREALHVLQSMDPAGIGARNLRECLLLQIYRHGRVSELTRRIVEEEFELLEKLKVASIAKKFDVMPEQIQSAMKEIGSLEPHPGRLVSATVANPITPDLIVEEVEGELVLMLNDRTVPSLKVSRAYAELLKKGSRASTDEKKYVREKLNSATWLIRAIEQRKSTMLKVMQAIIESQPDFFKIGPTYLRPLILQDVADKISMHISTVSRVTNGKYVQTSHGIFELKYFFTAGVTQSDGREVSSVTTKDEIKKLIESEDPKKPLSDQKIVEILKSKELDVARRTVAKYRDQLEILPARLRKQY